MSENKFRVEEWTDENGVRRGKLRCYFDDPQSVNPDEYWKIRTIKASGIPEQYLDDAEYIEAMKTEEAP